jgi:hypothetical protein
VSNGFRQNSAFQSSVHQLPQDHQSTHLPTVVYRLPESAATTHLPTLVLGLPGSHLADERIVTGLHDGRIQNSNV